MNVFIGKRAAEFFMEHIVDGANNEIDHFHGCIDNSQTSNKFGESCLKKFIIKFDNDFLLGFGIINFGSTHFDTVVKFLQRFVFLFGIFLFEQREDLLHGLRNRIVANEGIIFEKCFEHRLGDDMLGKHFDGFGFGNGRIDIFVETFEKAVESFSVLFFGGNQFGNSLNVSFGNFGNILRPLFPIATVAHFFHHFGIEKCLHFFELE